MSLLKDQVRIYERRLIDDMIRECRGNMRKVSRALGISHTQLYDKLRYQRSVDLTASWDDEPIAWAIRREGDRVALGACWTREEIAADASDSGTVALVFDHGDALNLVREMNTTIAVRAALPAVVVTEDVCYVH